VLESFFKIIFNIYSNTKTLLRQFDTSTKKKKKEQDERMKKPLKDSLANFVFKDN
jgi:hypothetical protein